MAGGPDDRVKRVGRAAGGLTRNDGCDDRVKWTGGSAKRGPDDGLVIGPSADIAGGWSREGVCWRRRGRVLKSAKTGVVC